ncbi:MAG: tetratricopeptide repeat protein [Burkholderiales bacterium]
MALALWLALPGASLVERLSQSSRSDLLTVAYLRAWLAAEPEDLPLQLALARKHLGLGDWDAAIAALAEPSVARSPDMRRDAQWLKMEVLERRLASATPGTPERTAAAAGVAAQLALVATMEAERATDAGMLEPLWQRALASGDAALVRRLFEARSRLAPPPGTAPDAWYVRLSADAERLGDPLEAARLRWAAFDAATGDEVRRTHLFAAVRLLQAADRTAQACADADARIGRLQPDAGLMKFMVKLAMAAGRPDLADRYAREMLKFALLRELERLQAGDDVPALRTVSNAAAEPVRAPKPHRPFDDATYALAYEVFLANRNVADAYEVAAAAVRHAPDDATWRRRLAQAADWSNRPVDALEQWLWLARRGGGKVEWDRVEQLAAGVRDSAVMLEALRMRAARGGDEALDLRIAKLIEDEGQPREAIAWLEQRIEARGVARSRTLLERQMALNEALGDLDAVLRALDRADAEAGPDPARALRRATVLLDRGDVHGGFASLHRLRDRVAALAEAPELPRTPGDTERVTWWHLYARLAEQLQREDDADFAYRLLVRLERAGPDELTDWSGLLEHRSLHAAAVVAEHAWRAGRHPLHGDRAFSLWMRLGDFTALERIGHDMAPGQLAVLQRDVGYLQALSNHLQSIGDDTGARRALQRALELEPGDPQLRAALMWMLLAQRDATTLRTALLRGDARAEREPALWGVHAAGWMALDQPQRALRWFVRQARRGGDDYLWQLAYADCLEQNGMPDAAWTVRRRAWTELRALAPAQRDASPRQRQAALALAARFAPADSARAALRQLAEDVTAATIAGRREAQAPRRAEADPPPADAAGLLRRVDAALAAPRRGVEVASLASTAGWSDGIVSDASERLDSRAVVSGGRELILSWMLSRESSDAARAWLLSRYATQVTRPGWARLAVALDTGDREALASLVDALPDWLPRAEQIEAMRKTGRLAEAQTLAWNLHDERPAIDDAHRRVVDTLLPDASYAAVELAGGQIGTLGVRTTRLQVRRSVAPGVSVGALVDHDAQRALEPAQLLDVPASALRVAATAHWRGTSMQADAELSAYSSVKDRVGARVALRGAPDSDRGPSAVVGLRQVATESAPLRVAGMKDVVELRWTQPITGRDRIVASVAPTWLMSQDGSTLGTGTVWTLGASHRVRMEYPDLTLKAIATVSDWRARTVADTLVAPRVPAEAGDPTRAVVPAASSEVAAGVSFGESVAQTYSRAIRPFGEVLLRANSVTGAGYALRAGITTSLLGADRLSAFVGLLSPTPGLPDGVRLFGIAYHLPIR